MSIEDLCRRLEDIKGLLRTIDSDYCNQHDEEPTKDEKATIDEAIRQLRDAY